ncbi:hypothetical protein, partial [Microbacterium aurantiacum]
CRGAFGIVRVLELHASGCAAAPADDPGRGRGAPLLRPTSSALRALRVAFRAIPLLGTFVPPRQNNEEGKERPHTMSTVAISTITTVLSVYADEHTTNMRRLADRAMVLADHARHGYQLVSTGIIPGEEGTTIVDTLQKVEAGA